MHSTGAVRIVVWPDQIYDVQLGLASLPRGMRQSRPCSPSQAAGRGNPRCLVLVRSFQSAYIHPAQWQRPPRRCPFLAQRPTRACRGALSDTSVGASMPHVPHGDGMGQSARDGEWLAARYSGFQRPSEALTPPYRDLDDWKSTQCGVCLLAPAQPAPRLW